MDKALASGAGDCGFESHRDRLIFLFLLTFLDVFDWYRQYIVSLLDFECLFLLAQNKRFIFIPTV